MTDPNDLEGTRTPEEIAEDFRELNRIAPTPADRFKLMFSAMNDLPANLPPLPPVPPGFDRWEYRGTNYASNSGMHDHCEEGCDYWARHTKGYPLDWSLFGDPRTHVIEAVRDEPATIKEAVDQWHAAKDQPASGELPAAFQEAFTKHFPAFREQMRAIGAPTGTEARAHEDALAPFRKVASGIPDNWPGDCILRFDQRGDGSIFLSYHGVNDASGGITIDQWRALIDERRAK